MSRLRKTPLAALAVLVFQVLQPVVGATAAHALSFNNVVSIGDSLVNLFGDDRGPIVAENLASRLGVSNTNFFTASFATTDAIVSAGAHTAAAASFGAGDLAVLWFGGNDFTAAAAAIATGDFSFLDQSEANYSTVLDTLRNDGMDVLILNLFDVNQAPQGLSQIPDALRPTFRAATQEWNARLQALAANSGAAYANFFGLVDALYANPAAFSILFVEPVLAPLTGCNECLFFDEQHISSLGRVYATNVAIGALDATFDPGGTMPLASLGPQEIAALAQIPEPGTSALLGVGLAVPGLRRESRPQAQTRRA